jgi:uncharacterized protein YbjT (DUF2867 family)
MKKVLLAGSNGLIGRHFLMDASAKDVQITALVRKTGLLPVSKGMVTEFVTNFGDDLKNLFASTAFDYVVCALGTTIKKAGSQEAFRHVDHDLPIQLAQFAKKSGIRKFALVSSVGADASSRVFYTRVKGETERDLLAIEIENTMILRPTLLLGERGEFRVGEVIAKRLEFITPKKYKPIHSETVAAALWSGLASPSFGTLVLETGGIHEWASKKM